MTQRLTEIKLTPKKLPPFSILHIPPLGVNLAACEKLLQQNTCRRGIHACTRANRTRRHRCRCRCLSRPTPSKLPPRNLVNIYSARGCGKNTKVCGLPYTVPSCHGELVVKDMKLDVPRVHAVFRVTYAGYFCRAVSVFDVDRREVGGTLEPIDGVHTHAPAAELERVSVVSSSVYT